MKKISRIINRPKSTQSKPIIITHTNALKEIVPDSWLQIFSYLKPKHRAAFRETCKDAMHLVDQFYINQATTFSTEKVKTQFDLLSTRILPEILHRLKHEPEAREIIEYYFQFILPMRVCDPKQHATAIEIINYTIITNNIRKIDPLLLTKSIIELLSNSKIPSLFYDMQDIDFLVENGIFITLLGILYNKFKNFNDSELQTYCDQFLNELKTITQSNSDIHLNDIDQNARAFIRNIRNLLKEAKLRSKKEYTQFILKEFFSRLTERHPYTKANLSGIDLSNIDYETINIISYPFKFGSFSEKKQPNFNNFILKFVNFSHSTFPYANFENTVLLGSNIENADFSYAKFTNSKMNHIKLNNKTILSHADLTDAEINGTNLKDIKLDSTLSSPVLLAKIYLPEHVLLSDKENLFQGLDQLASHLKHITDKIQRWTFRSNVQSYIIDVLSNQTVETVDALEKQLKLIDKIEHHPLFKVSVKSNLNIFFAQDSKKFCHKEYEKYKETLIATFKENIKFKK